MFVERSNDACGRSDGDAVSGNRTRDDGPRADDRPLAHVGHDDRPGADPGAAADAHLSIELRLLVHGLAVLAGAMLIAAAENLHVIGQHHFVADLGKADAAEPTNISAITDFGFGHRKCAVPAEVNILAATPQGSAIKRLSGIDAAHAGNSCDGLAGGKERSASDDAPGRHITQQSRPAQHAERCLDAPLRADGAGRSPRGVDPHGIAGSIRLGKNLAHALTVSATTGSVRGESSPSYIFAIFSIRS